MYTSVKCFDAVVGLQEVHPACKKLATAILIGLSLMTWLSEQKTKCTSINDSDEIS